MPWSRPGDAHPDRPLPPTETTHTGPLPSGRALTPALGRAAPPARRRPPRLARRPLAAPAVPVGRPRQAVDGGRRPPRAPEGTAAAGRLPRAGLAGGLQRA